jgi:hypothetical protein
MLRLKGSLTGATVASLGSPQEGDFVYDSTNKAIAFCNGTTWLDLSSGSGSLTWPLAGAADTASAPDYSWASHTNTGLYYNTGIGFAVSGASVGSITSTGLNGMAIGATTASTGNFAKSGAGAAVYASSTNGYAVYGSSSTNGDAVYGVSVDGNGVRGSSTNSAGVYGFSSSSRGVGGYSNTGPGGSFYSDSGSGVMGSCSTNGYGVYGSSDSGTGVYGSSSSGVGGKFSSTSGFALITGTGNVGIGSASPVATLDVNGYARLKPQTSAPVACTSTTKGAIAFASSAGSLCVCDGSTWRFDSNAYVCSW